VIICDAQRVNLRDSWALRQLGWVVVSGTREMTIKFGFHSDVRAVVVGDLFLLMGWEDRVVRARSRHIQVALLQLILHPVSKLGLSALLIITLFEVEVAY